MATILQKAPNAQGDGTATKLAGPGNVPAPQQGSVAGAATSFAPQPRNLAQKALGVVADPIAKASTRAGQAVGGLIVKGVEGIQRATGHGAAADREEKNLQQELNTPVQTPLTGTIVKPANQETVESTAGDAIQTVALGMSSPAAAGALLMGGGALSDKKSAGTVALDSVFGAFVSKLAEYGFKAMQPYIENGLQKYGIPFYNKIADKIPDAVKDSYKAIAEKVGNAIPKSDAPIATKAGAKLDAAATKVSDAVDKVTDKVIPNAAKPKTSMEKTLEAIQTTEENMTKNERKAAIDEGRATTTKLGATKYAPTEPEKRAAEILDGKLTGDAVKNVAVVKDEIATRGKEAETYLKANSKTISAQEQADAFDSFRKKAEKTMTQPELNAYDEQMKLFLKQLPGRGGYNTANFYSAVKDWESEVADRLPKGKEAIMDPTGVASAKVRAASDVRTIVRDLIGQKNPEFKDRMYDLMSLYGAKDTTVINAEARKGNIFSRAAKSKTGKLVGSLAKGGAALEVARKAVTGNF